MADIYEAASSLKRLQSRLIRTPKLECLRCQDFAEVVAALQAISHIFNSCEALSWRTEDEEIQDELRNLVITEQRLIKRTALLLAEAVGKNAAELVQLLGQRRGEKECG